jgi:hypothetical protein
MEKDADQSNDIFPINVARKPEIFVIGAPKCGTTALCRYLSEHPGVCFSNPKEPSYFCTDFPGYADVGSDAEYLRTYFGHCKQPHQLLGEGSATYLYSRTAVRNILAFNERARFIVMLRNPVDMVHALHSQFLYDGAEDVKDFEVAWSLQSRRRSGYGIPAGCIEPSFLQYGEVGRLGEQLHRLFADAGRDRCLLLMIEGLAKTPAKVYGRVLEFLALGDDDRKEFRRLNENKEHRLHALGMSLASIRDKPPRILLSIPGLRQLGRMLMRLNSVKTARPALRAEFRGQLVESFSDDIARLEIYLQRDLGHWRETT